MSSMAGRARHLTLVIAMGLAAIGCGAVPIPFADGVVVDGWVFPTPAPLPEGATALPLAADLPPPTVPDGIELAACPAALHEPVTLRVDRAARPPVLHFLAADGREVGLQWSIGTSAREIDGVAEVVMPDGSLIVREGEESVLELGGGYLGAGDVFSACLTTPHRLDPDAT
ncbi:MAG: hypothetical protein ACSLFN_09165 [Candidatus Limnocylindrales bacterium]